MWESLKPIFTWAYGSYLGTIIRDSTWAFAYIEVFHLFGLTLVLGAVLVVGLRMAGVIWKRQTLRNVVRETAPVFLIGFLLVTISGVLMFAAEATKCFNNIAFKPKMIFFFGGILFYFLVCRKMFRKNEVSRVSGTLVGFLMIVIWFGVGVFGRAIGFF